MYWAYFKQGLLNQKACFTAGPPDYSWREDEYNNIPKDASHL